VERPRTYPSDLTDAQWAVIEPMLPLPKWLGRPELHSRRPQGRADRRDHRLPVGQGADTVGRDSRGYDAGKKVNGRKRFIVTDTLGLLIVVSVAAASVHDTHGAKYALLCTYLATPIRFVFADARFAGKLVDWTRRTLN
jgi:transposase